MAALRKADRSDQRLAHIARHIRPVSAVGTVDLGLDERTAFGEVAVTGFSGTMRATEDPGAGLDLVTEDPAAAPLALRRHGMDGAFEAVEGRGAVTTRDRERLVVLISAGFTPSHRLLNPFLRKVGTGRAEAEAVSRTLSACAQADAGPVRPCCGRVPADPRRHTRPGSIGCFVAGVVRDGVRPLGRGVGR